jgi:titin
MILLGGLGGNVVQGNRLGVGLSGSTVFPAPPHLPYGVHIRSDNNVVGLMPSGEGEPNIFGGPGFGVVIGQYQVSRHTTILGNYFGMDEEGNPLPQADRRIAIFNVSDSEDTAVGSPGLGNRICCYNEGVRLSAFPTDVRILGNHFESMTYSAIFVLGSIPPVQIGDVNPGSWNTFIGNGLPTASPGIKLLGDAKGVTIRGNVIRDSGGLGIDLLNTGTTQYSFPDGPTPNDAMDADDGGNGLQNYPVLAEATAGAGVVTIHGSLNSQPNKSFRLEFYSNDTADPSGHGEGENPLGTVDVTTDGAGNATFLAVLPGDVPLGHVVSATATGADGSTSEFSAVVPFVTVTSGETVQDVIEAVGHLVASGDLATGPSKGLVAILTQATSQIEAGNDATAIQQLQAFIQLVGKFATSGNLEPEYGQTLIDLALVAIQRLGG